MSDPRRHSFMPIYSLRTYKIFSFIHLVSLVKIKEITRKTVNKI